MKTKYGLMQTEGYKARKQQRMARMQSIRKRRTIRNARDYLAIVNGVSGEGRINSRKKIIRRNSKGIDIND